MPHTFFSLAEGGQEGQSFYQTGNIHFPYLLHMTLSLLLWVVSNRLAARTRSNDSRLRQYPLEERYLVPCMINASEERI